MREQPLFTVEQNIKYPLGVIAFSILFIFTLFYLVELDGNATRMWKLMIIGIVLIVLIAHIAHRIFSWEFEIYKDRLIVKRPFGLGKKSLKTLEFEEIERIHFSVGYRMPRKMMIYTKTKKRYGAFYDLKLAEHRELATLLMENDVELSLSGGSWTF